MFLNYLKDNILIRIASYFILMTVIICSFMSGRILNFRREIQVAKGLIEAGEFVQGNFEESLKSYLDVHKKIMENLQTVRPGEKDIVSFINQLETVAKEAGLEVNIKNLDPISDQGKGELNFVEYNISSSGTEAQLISYLAELEKLPYYLKIDNLSYKKMDGRRKTDEPPNINLIFDLYIK